MFRIHRSVLNPLLIAAIYAVASWLWIAFSDSLVGMIATDPETLTRLQTAKGMFFVLVSAVILFGLVHRGQAQLVRSETRYRTLFETSPMPQLLINARDHRILDMNNAACSLYSSRPDDLRQLRIEELMCSPDTPMSRDPTSGHHCHRSRAGRELDVRVQSSTLLVDAQNCLLLHIQDVTESLRQERGRLQAEHNFREALSGTLFVLYRHNLANDTFDYISPSITRFTGLEPAELTQPGGGAKLRELFHPEDLVRAEQDNAHAAGRAHGASANVDTEMRLRAGDGNYRWIHNAKTLLLSPEGMITHVVGAAVDVSDSHSAREHLLVTLRSIAEGVITTDRHNRITLMNPVAEALTGWSEGSARDCPLELVLPLDPPFPDNRESAVSGLRTRLRRRDARLLQVSCSRAPIRMGDDALPSGNILVIHDLTAELDARARLDAEERRYRESQARYALAMQGTNEGLWDWNPITLDLLLSSRLLSILGMQEEEHLLTTSNDWLSRIHPADVDNFQTTLIAHLKQQTPHFECEYRVRTDQGDYRWVLARGLALFNPDGPAYRMVGSVGDITDRKHDEEQLRQWNAELEQRVADRTQQLQTTLQELESFSYSVSHDLRAPLRAIDGYSSILANDYREALDDEAGELLRRMRAAVQRMGLLIDDLLNLSRVTRQPLERQRINLSEVAQGIIDELRLRDPQRCVACQIDQNLLCSADPSLIAIVLQNLLDNAWKFTAHVGDARIRFSLESAPDGGPVFAVSDNGAGFDMRYKDKLFTPFQRLHSGREFEGTGVGLATVARIIHRHGGQVWAESSPGQGAVFRFTLARE